VRRPASLGATLCLAALALLVPWVAGAAAAKKTPLEAARAQMDEASFEKAVSIADAALRGTLSDADRAAFQLLRAEAFSALGRAGPMRDALDLALRADAAAAYDESTAKPELLEALSAARQKLAGKVSVSAPPAGTPAPVVLLDGESLGKAPVEATTTVGKHQVSLVWNASSRTDATVVVRTDAVTPVEVVPPGDLKPVVRAPPPVVEEKKPVGGFRWPLVPLVAGGAVAVGGAVCLAVSGANYGALTGGDGTSTLNLNRAEAQSFANENQALQGVGIAFVSVGLAAAAFGGIFFFTGLDQPKVAVGAGASPSGAALVLTGTLP
jgi:hypothetical protein